MYLAKLYVFTSISICPFRITSIMLAQAFIEIPRGDTNIQWSLFLDAITNIFTSYKIKPVFFHIFAIPRFINMGFLCPFNCYFIIVCHNHYIFHKNNKKKAMNNL